MDVGSGSGAKALLYSQLGARQVVGLELNQDNVGRATTRMQARRAADEAAHRVRFVHGDATCMPFTTASFDLIVSNNTFEHIIPPGAALAECARVLRPGGRAYLRFPPYWSAWGSHLYRWIKFPWCHVLFSEPTLISAVNRIEARRRLNDLYPPFARLDLHGQTRFTHVNRLTMAQFERLVARLPLRVVGLRLLPIGYQFLPRLAQRWRRLGWLPQAAAAALRTAVRTRLGREVIATAVVVVLERVGA